MRQGLCQFTALRLAIVGWCFLVFIAGCWSASQPEVVVYAALDREFSEPILNDFTKATGIRVLAKYDDESTKTVGLTNADHQEASRPRCDVFWNNEILNTLRLEEKGLLDAYHSPAAEAYPEMYRSPDGTWHGFAARARMLIVNTKLVAEATAAEVDLRPGRPQVERQDRHRQAARRHHRHARRLLVRGSGRRKGQGVLPQPEGQRRADPRRQQASRPRRRRGQIAFGLTDTDDAIIEIERGQPGDDRLSRPRGRSARHALHSQHAGDHQGLPPSRAAPKSWSIICSRRPSRKNSPSAQRPDSAQPNVKTKPRVETPQTVKAMPVDFAAAAKHWDAAVKFIENEFLAK